MENIRASGARYGTGTHGIQIREQMMGYRRFMEDLSIWKLCVYHFSLHPFFSGGWVGGIVVRI
jgi:hypothetical protein